MPRKPDPQSLRQHLTKDGRRCQMPLAPDSPSLCAFHERAAAKLAASQFRASQTLHTPIDGDPDHPVNDPAETAVIAAELLAGAENLSTPASVNLFLGNLLRQVAHNRISRKNAIAMAYISQLLLNSISVMHRQARDAQIAALAAESAKPTKIIFDMPRPRRDDPDDSDHDADCGQRENPRQPGAHEQRHEQHNCVAPQPPNSSAAPP